MKAIYINVYKNQRFDCCPNGGITERFDDLLIECEDGYVEIDEDRIPENFVVYVDRVIGGKKCGYLRPYADPEPGRTDYMFGGAYGATSDSRFSDMIGGMYGAVPIHDRTETWEQYDLLSH